MRKLLLFSCLLAAGPQGAAAYEDRGVPAPPGIVAESAAPPPVLDDGPAKTFIEPELVEGTCFANACENDRLSAKFANYYDPFGTQFVYGPGAVQPYRYGWYSYNDLVYVPTSKTNGVPGSLQDIEWNSWMRYSEPLGDNVIFSWVPTWNSKFWVAPTSIDLPANVNVIQSELRLTYLASESWWGEVAVTPQVNSDFHGMINSNALMVDARAVGFYRSSPEWTFALGGAYWNRVVDRVVPYAGVVWSPDGPWEFRVTYPKSRISCYLGNVFGCDAWVYGVAEYNVEAYQVDLPNINSNERMEISDRRVLAGINALRGKYSMFLEGGRIYDRQARFSGSAPAFSISDALIVRMGLAY